MAKHSRSFIFKFPTQKMSLLLIALTALVAIGGIILAIVLAQKEPTKTDPASSLPSVSSAASHTESVDSGSTLSLPSEVVSQIPNAPSSQYPIQSYVPGEKVIQVERGDELVFQCGGQATVRIKAVPNTLYTLEIHPTGRDPLTVGSKKTDGNGNAAWDWTLDPTLDGGEYPFVISGAGEREEFYVWIEDR